MFNKRNSRKSMLILLISILGAQSCINQEDFEFDNFAGVKANPSVAIPLLYGTLTIQDLLPLEEVENVWEDQDGLIHLVYSDTLRHTSIHDYFLLKPLFLNESYPIGVASIVAGDQQIVIEDQQNLDLGFPEADFEEIRLKEGTLEITSSRSVESEILFHYSFPTLKKNGKPLAIQVTLPQGSLPRQKVTTADLAGYEMDLSGYRTGENFLPVNIRAEVNKQASEFIGPTDELGVQLEIGGLKFNLLTGDLGQPIVELPAGEIPISVFENVFNDGKFGLKAPVLSFDVLNSNGAPLRVTTKTLQARNQESDAINIDINPSSPIDVSYPIKYGETSLTRLEILNVGEIIELAPSFIDYRLSGQLNMSPASGLNFLTDSSELAVVLNADVPLWGYLEGFSLSDTLTMALDVQDVDVNNASLRLNIENEFPLEAQLQIVFINDNYDVLETLFAEDFKTLIPASTVNSEGDLVSSGKYTGGDIIIDSKRFERILKASNMIIKANLYTTRNSDGTQPHVKIKTGYKLNVNLGVQTTATLTVKP